MKTVNYQKLSIYAVLAIALFIIHEQFASVILLKNVFSWSLLLHYSIDIAFFAVVVYILSKCPLQKARDYYLFLAINIALALLYVLFHVVDRWLVRAMMGNMMAFKIDSEFIYYSYIRGGYVLSFALAVDFFRRGKKGEFEAQEAKIKQQDLEYALHFTQASPHLMTNGLIFINDLVEPSLPVVSKALLRLSSIYRYSALDMDAVKKVPLADELDQVRNYLEFHDQLYDKQPNILYEVQVAEHDAITRYIPPMLLLNPVENIFKHGQYRDRKHPVVIRISCKDNRLHFYASNPLRSGSRSLSGGLGMKHIKVKLEHQFPGRYKLEYGVRGNDYVLELTVEYGAAAL